MCRDETCSLYNWIACLTDWQASLLRTHTASACRTGRFALTLEDFVLLHKTVTGLKFRVLPHNENVRLVVLMKPTFNNAFFFDKMCNDSLR